MPRERIAGLAACEDHVEVVEIAWGKVDLDHRGIQLGTGEVGISVTVTGSPGSLYVSGTPAPVATFDRQRLNDLIRVLRRARDQAFGADA